MQNQFGIFFLFVIVVSTIIIFHTIQREDGFEFFLDKSGPYIGANYSHNLGYYGKGIIIGVIDTGVDHKHPDLFGFGQDGKVIGGHSFVDKDKMPIDTNGHGTQVAGILAADGQLKGIAPDSKIISYKVSEDGESVSSDLIIKAVQRAMEDDVDIINISLGVNRTNPKIDQVVSQAIESGIVVVTAAGNDGPGLGTIGSPGINPNSITVGASYNNITASLVGTLTVNDEQYQVIPMVGTEPLDEPVEAKIIFGGYGRERDFSDDKFTNSIVLVERGSDVEGEIVYFSDKENNAANAKAKAVIVFNNEPGIFLGELVHEFSGLNYQPRIPALSMAREDGLALKEILVNKTVGSLNVFYNPDFVAHFSSRGPVSPFYIKPDLVAPGAFVNSTLAGGNYNFTSGTSFAAPHVAGAAALLLEKNPEFQPNEIKSILLTTTDIVSDAYQAEFPLEIAGSGRLNLTRAFKADLIISPPNLIFNLTPEKQTETLVLQLKKTEGDLGNVKVSFNDPKIINLDYKLEDNTIEVSVSLNEEIYGSIEGRIFIENGNVVYNVPILVQVTKASVQALEQDGELIFNINHLEEWDYAKITITNAGTGKIDSTSSVPKRNSKLPVYENGEYWIEAKVQVDGKTFDAFEKVEVKSAKNKDYQMLDLFKIPERQMLIVFGIIVVVSLVGLRIRK